MRVLVTGGSGFIGSHLVDTLLRLAHDVVSFDKRPYNGTVDSAALHTVVGDICDTQALKHAAAGCSIVFHLAAIPRAQPSLLYPHRTNKANVEGTLTVLEAARHAHARVVYASSSSVYGGMQHEPCPCSPYAASKLAGEAYCCAYRLAHGMNITVLRYFSVYGPRQNPDSEYAAVIPRFITALRDKRQPSIFGNGLQARDFTYVKDVVDATIRAGFQYPGETMDIGAGMPCSVNDLLCTVGRLMNVSPEPLFLPALRGDMRHSEADTTNAKRFLDWEPRYSLEEGLRETIDYYCAVS